MRSFREHLADARKLTVYHGTSQDFDQFDQGRARLPNDLFGGGVAYFTTSKDIAKSYARATAKKHPENIGRVYTCKIVFNKLFDVDDIFTGKKLIDVLPSDTDAFARGAGLMTFGKDPIDVQLQLERGEVSLTGEQVFNGLSRGMNTTAKAREHLKSRGYDALRYNGGQIMGAEKHSVFLVYYASNIDIVKKEVTTGAAAGA